MKTVVSVLALTFGVALLTALSALVIGGNINPTPSNYTASRLAQVTELEDIGHDTPTTKLMRQLTTCVGTWTHEVDKNCLKESFFPLLGLNNKDSIEFAHFGHNSEGDYFAIELIKYSNKATGLFNIGFNTRIIRNVGPNLETTIFLAVDGRIRTSGGKNFSTPSDYPGIGVINIYDRLAGEYVVDSGAGYPVNTGYLTSPSIYNADSLINSGKNVGTILNQYLDYIDPKYTLQYGNTQKNRKYIKEIIRDRYSNFVNLLK